MSLPRHPQPSNGFKAERSKAGRTKGNLKGPDPKGFLGPIRSSANKSYWLVDQRGKATER